MGLKVNLLLIGKLTTVVLGISTMLLYRCGRITTRDPFFPIIITSLAWSILSLSLHFIKRINDHVVFKVVDIILHGLAAIGLATYGIKFDIDVNDFLQEDGEEEVQQIQDWPIFSTVEAFASGIVAAINGMVHLVVAFLLIGQWCRKKET